MLSNKEELMKSRGYVATLRSAYLMFRDHFHTIVRHVWPFAIAMGVVGGAFTTYQVSHIGQPFSAVSLFVLLSALLLLFFASALFYSRSTMFLNEKSMKWNLGRVLKIQLWAILIYGIVFGIIGAGVGFYAASIQKDLQNVVPNAATEVQTQYSFLKLTVITILSCLVGLLLLLPVWYSFYKYLLEPDTHFHKIFFKSFRVGARHWGYIFITLLLVSLCIMFVMLLISFPSNVLMLALKQSVAGELEGDPSGVPDYFGALVYAVSMLTYICSSLLGIFVLFVGYFMYGSIKNKELEKKKAQFIDTQENSITQNQPVRP